MTYYNYCSTIFFEVFLHLNPTMTFTKPATKRRLEKTLANLSKNGIDAQIVQTGQEARDKVLSLIPAGAEVMTMTSITLEQLGLTQEINESGKYKSVKNKLSLMDRKTQGQEMQKEGAAAQWSIGSIHAVTEKGNVYVASNSGSQMPGYAYGSANVIWVASTKKIVKDANEAIERINEHIVPLESERARKAYNLPDSFNTFVSKLLIFNRELIPNRVKMVFVNEDLGF